MKSRTEKKTSYLSASPDATKKYCFYECREQEAAWWRRTLCSTPLATPSTGMPAPLGWNFATTWGLWCSFGYLIDWRLDWDNDCEYLLIEYILLLLIRCEGVLPPPVTGLTLQSSMSPLQTLCSKAMLQLVGRILT